MLQTIAFTDAWKNGPPIRTRETSVHQNVNVNNVVLWKVRGKRSFVRDEVDPLQQLNITKRGVEYELKKQLEQLKGYKFVYIY